MRLGDSGPSKDCVYLNQVHAVSMRGKGEDEEHGLPKYVQGSGIVLLHTRYIVDEEYADNI